MMAPHIDELAAFFRRAEQLVTLAQDAHQAAEHLGGEVKALRARLAVLSAKLESAQGEAAFWQTRAMAAHHALNRWQAFDRATKREPETPARTRAYCSALAATREAMAGFEPGQVH